MVARGRGSVLFALLAGGLAAASACGGKVEAPSSGTVVNTGGATSGGGGLPGGGGAPFGGGGGPSGGGTPGGGGAPGGGGLGGTGGFDAGVTLGRACATDAECWSVFQCMTASSGIFDGEGPAKGYCTKTCMSDTDCISPTAHCQPYKMGKGLCLEGCELGPPNLQQFDPKKCHGRQEVACSPFFDASGAYAGAACFPQCNADPDCGLGLHCDPRTGLCATTAPTGQSLGEACGTSGSDTCQGSCVALPNMAPFCTQGCTLGAMPACGWDGPGTGPAPGACLFASSDVIDHGGPGLGDYGYCGQLCSCNSDCKSASFVCHAWESNAAQLEQVFGKQGYCADPAAADGGVDPGIPSCGG